MIAGIGVDIVDVADLRRRMERSPDLEARVFHPEESVWCRGMAEPWQHFAARFAAKEAVMKALGTGWSQGVAFRDIVVVREGDGPPVVELHEEAARRVAAVGGRVAISLSHAAGTAVAFAVVETGEVRS